VRLENFTEHLRLALDQLLHPCEQTDLVQHDEPVWAVVDSLQEVAVRPQIGITEVELHLRRHAFLERRAAKGEMIVRQDDHHAFLHASQELSQLIVFRESIQEFGDTTESD